MGRALCRCWRPWAGAGARGQGLGGAAEGPTGPRRVHLPAAWAKRGLTQLPEGRRGDARSGRAGQWPLCSGLRIQLFWTHSLACGPLGRCHFWGPLTSNHSCHLLNTYYVSDFTLCHSIKKQPSLWRRDHFFPILQTLRFLAQGQ